MLLSENWCCKKKKAAVDVDVKSKEWKLYSCRILMDGVDFDTYFSARKAEIFAQNHSTMKSFEESYALKQKTRKRPVVHFGSSSPASSTGSEHQDFKNIRTLSQRDAGIDIDMDKEYDYSEHLGKNSNGWLSDEELCDSDAEQSLTNGKFQCSKNDGSIEINNDNNCSDKSASGGNDNAKIGSFVEEDGDDFDPLMIGVDDSSNNDNSSEEEENNHQNHTNENNILSPIGNNFSLESTNKEHRDLNISSINSGHHHFSDARPHIPHIERAVMSACQLLEENAQMVKEIRQNSRETKLLVESLIPIVKDLTVEVFDSKKEIKKRNGLFTDVLEPKIQLSIKKVKQFENVELALKKHKMVDNMIKYLGSTINESNEKNFLKRCLDVVFEEKFFMKKVWWKKKPGKVLIKHSMILHCVRESFKVKFGLVEPIRSDKEINDLIHKICSNVKDNIRKAIKAKEKEMAAQQVKLYQEAKEKDENQENGVTVQEDEAEQKKIKKSVKRAAKRAAEEIEKNKSKTIPGDGEGDLNTKNKKIKKNAETKRTEIKLSKLEKAKQATKETNQNGCDQNLAKPADKETENTVDEMSANNYEKIKKTKKQTKKLAKLEKAKRDAVEDILSEAGGKCGSQEEAQTNAYVKKAKKGEKVKYAKTD